MPFFTLFDEHGRHIAPDQDLHTLATEPNLERLVDSVRSGQQVLNKLSVDDIIGVCDAVASSWIASNHPLASTIRDLGLGFIPLWMRRNNLESLCDVSLGGDRETLDRFVAANKGGRKKIRCQPRGLVVHWIAGNVPVLGLISALQGVLGKNATIVKVSRNDPWLLPALLESFNDVTYVTSGGEQISGRVITDSIAVIYCDRDDRQAAVELSTLADVRVAWGGREAVESVMNLPRRYGTEDIIFGPKTSFIVVGREYLSDPEQVDSIASDIVRDVAAFDQRGCNSPHTVFIEAGGSITPQQFAKRLSDVLRTELEQRPLRETQAGDCMNVLGARTEYEMRGDAYYSEGIDWAVLYADDDHGLASPHYLRTLFVRPVADVFDVAQFCSLNTQSAGLAIGERHIELADRLTAAGVERCPPVGKMSAYDSPWDGMFPLSRMVRWVSTIEY